MNMSSKSSAAHSFKSSAFFFRPTSLGQRMAEAGLVKSPHLIREPKVEVIKGNRHTVLRSSDWLLKPALGLFRNTKP